jgi:hypothetical protein
VTQPLGREDLLLAAQNRKRTLVEIPELGTLYIQELSTSQLLEYNMLMLDYEGKRIPPTAFAKIVAQMIVFSVCDAEGNTLYTAADVDALALLDLKVLMTLRKRITELSGVGKSNEEVVSDLKNAPAGSSSIA